MIKIDRSVQPVPVSLTTAGNVVDNERIAARRYYAVVPAPSKTYKFKRYKEEDIVEALEHLFHGKCAYCESKYIGTQKMDVEHYRPKGKVNESQGHPGYWWLALEWENLLPSCIDCNRRRGQKSYTLQDDGTFVFIDDTENAGKECAFPVSGVYRAQGRQDDLTLEIPLLINPCEHDPRDHLRWHINNLKLPLLLANSVQNLPDERGVKSIEIMGLNRFGLVTKRAEVLQPVVVQINSIFELIDITATLPPCEARDKYLTKIGRDIDALQTCYEPGREYAGMIKSYIDSHMDTLKEELARLLA
ncbi:hypothetical protein [Atlantibacter hermannii]|uniref:hypothetical protein n=1 Tax=Atlantibacter hermannii TaxID=565 RepID=UPI0028A82329|nr:hypothetical protein [Atlantibacter hermannii]